MYTMAGSLLKQEFLTEAFSIVENTQVMDGVVTKLRDFLKVDHVVYYSTKLEAPTVPYIRLTYPASWAIWFCARDLRGPCLSNGRSCRLRPRFNQMPLRTELV